jgi:Bacterial regulatory proteins, luxR family
MTVPQAGRLLLLVIVGVALCTSAAAAQTGVSGGIAGVVRDATGGVLPGVTVEASSPSLIEKERNKEIAEILRISDETVHTHLKNLFEKLEVRDRTRAVAIAIRRGVVQVR